MEILRLLKAMDEIIIITIMFIKIVCIAHYAAFLPAVNTTSQPVNLSRTVSQVVFMAGELGASRNFPICDLHL